MQERSTNAFGAPVPDPELTRLAPLVGAWAAEGRTLDSVLGRGVRVRSSETFHWLDGGYFLVQEYETVFGDRGAQRGVKYWFYDGETDTIRIIAFGNNGRFSESGNHYAGRLTSGKLTFEGPARFQYELDDDGRIGVAPDGTISVAWWLRDANGRWQPWMIETFHRDSGGEAGARDAGRERFRAVAGGVGRGGR